MKHYDYEWDLGPYGIILDQELDTDKLGWSGGDYFKLVNIDGTQILQKVDPIEVFAKGHKVNGKV